MNENKLQSPQHSNIRTVLRVGGPVIAASFGSFEPRFFWCVFLGIPLLFVGIGMCHFGYLGDFQRYVAGEFVPVAKDVVNYMGENIQPGFKALAKAITEGNIEGQKEQQQKP